MKRITCVLTLVVAPMIAIGCDSAQPPPPIAPAQPDPAPPAARKQKLPGLRSPASPTSPRATF
jgi:hypothetical protein